MKRAKLGVLVFMSLAVPLSGCRAMGQILYFFAPRQLTPPEFELVDGRVALVIECAHPEQENPVFSRALHDRFVEDLHRKRMPTEIVPFEELTLLRQSNRDFRQWSIQRIGRELRAEQVIYVRVERLRLRETPDHPLLSPSATLRVKVIGTHESDPDVRLWPDEPDGRSLDRYDRPPTEAVDRDAADAEARKLGRDIARFVSRLFYEWDTEDVPPPER